MVRDRLNTIRANSYNELVNMVSPKRTTLQLDRQRRRGRPLWQDPQLSHSVSGLCPTPRAGDPNSSKGDG